ncbi:MAG TPA: BON domain-containing protein [Candidatus Angelobacter sp.]|nr:BON domain-containing protein [Candidatus Angelobacter sp.]
MKNYVNKLALFVALSCGFALAQSMPPQQSQQPSSTTPSASQQTPDQSTQPSQPPATDQSAQPSQQTPDQSAQPSQQTPDQSTQPPAQSDQSTAPSTDQNSKMPQSDTAASAGGDVQSQVQTALQQDPKLANANINVMVNGKNLELSGTVPSGKEKKEAEKIAKTNAGSLKVKNHIKVASSNSSQSNPQGSNPPMSETAPQGTNPSGQSNPPASKPPML